MRKSISLGLVGAVLGTAMPVIESNADICYPLPGQCVTLTASKWDVKKYCPPKNQIENGKATVYFGTHSWLVCSDDDATLREFLRKNPKVSRIIVEGYSDIRGPEDLNQDISDQRGNSIEDRLRGFNYKGIIERTSHGESKAAVRDERNPNRLAKDRKVTLIADETVIGRALDLLPADIYLLDSSSSMTGDKIKTVREFKYPKSAALYSFGNSCKTATRLDDIKMIQTNCNTPLYVSLHDLIKQTESGKTITVLTDGANNSCCSTPQEIIELAKSKKIKINTIGVDARGYEYSTLQKIARGTDGNSYIAK